MKGFKGFRPDLTCNDFQFEENKTFEHEGEVRLCNRGFHFCENPLDCFNYYKPGDSIFHTVEAEEVADELGDDSKRVAKRITIGASLSIGDIVRAAVNFIFSKAEVSETDSATSGEGANSATSGYQANSAALGNGSSAEVSGAESIAIVTGKDSKARGELGCWLVLTERGGVFEIKHVKAVKVDGKKILPGVWYTVKSGKIVSVE